MSRLDIHSEKYFRIYEPYIAEVVNNYPEVTYFTPKQSINTFIARFRDALNGMRLNKHLSDRFTYEDCRKIFRLLKDDGDFVLTKLEGNSVYVGPKLKDNGAVVQKGVAIVEVGKNEIDARDDEVFRAFYLLKTKGFIPQPLEFRNVTQEQDALIQNNEIIEWFEAASGLYVMI